MDDALRDKLEFVIASRLEELNEVKPGSEEETAMTDNVVKLYKLAIDENRAATAWYEVEERLNLDREKMKNDILIKEHEWSIEDNRSKRIKPDTIATCGTVIGLTCLSIFYDKTGHMLPVRLLKFVDKLPIRH